MAKVQDPNGWGKIRTPIDSYLPKTNAKSGSASALEGANAYKPKTSAVSNQARAGYASPPKATTKDASKSWTKLANVTARQRSDAELKEMNVRAGRAASASGHTTRHNIPLSPKSGGTLTISHNNNRPGAVRNSQARPLMASATFGATPAAPATPAASRPRNNHAHLGNVAGVNRPAAAPAQPHRNRPQVGSVVFGSTAFAPATPAVAATPAAPAAPRNRRPQNGTVSAAFLSGATPAAPATPAIPTAPAAPAAAAPRPHNNRPRGGAVEIFNSPTPAQAAPAPAFVEHQLGAFNADAAPAPTPAPAPVALAAPAPKAQKGQLNAAVFGGVAAPANNASLPAGNIKTAAMNGGGHHKRRR